MTGKGNTDMEAGGGGGAVGGGGEETFAAAAAQLDAHGKGGNTEWSSMNIDTGVGIRKRTVRVMPLLAIVVVFATLFAIVSVGVWAIAVVPNLPAFKHTKTRSPANLEREADTMLVNLKTSLTQDETILDRIDTAVDKLESEADDPVLSEEVVEKINDLEDKLTDDESSVVAEEGQEVGAERAIETAEDKLKAETAAGSGATEADIKETEETLVTAISDAKAAVDENSAEIGDGK